MKRSTIATLAFLVIAITAIIVYRYEAYIVRGDYLVDGAAPCGPAAGACFAADCSPDEDAACDTTPYEKVELPARNAPACLLDNDCDSLSCTEANECTVTLCTADAAEDGEVCVASDEEPVTEPDAEPESVP